MRIPAEKAMKALDKAYAEEMRVIFRNLTLNDRRDEHDRKIRDGLAHADAIYDVFAKIIEGKP